MKVLRHKVSLLKFSPEIEQKKPADSLLVFDWYWTTQYLKRVCSLSDIESVSVHHFSPNRDEVFNKFLLVIVLCIHFSVRAQDRV